MSITILYEDNHLIAVVKPTGVLSQGDKTGDVSLLDDVKMYLKEKKNKKTPSNPSGQAGNVFVGLLHRLDRPATGIVLFAKTSKGASRLSEQFRNHTIEKSYSVLVVGRPKKDRGMLTNVLGKDERLMKAKEYADGSEANLSYQVIKSSESYSLLEIKIDGGKFHQIRAQLSLAGMPIVGDVKYGGEKWPARAGGANEKGIALCATGLSFNCATEDKRVNLTIEIPKEWQEYLSTE